MYKRWAKGYDIPSNMAANSSKIPPRPLAELQSSLHKYYLIIWLQTQRKIFHDDSENHNRTHSCTTHVLRNTQQESYTLQRDSTSVLRTYKYIL